ncbi:MAG: VOC family protein [Alphaproteobacteria bacterium]
MTVFGLDHVTIKTPRVAETRAFFVDVLGLEEGWRPDLASRGSWLYARGVPVLHLVEIDAELPGDGALEHFSLAIADMDAMLARLEARGISYRHIHSANDLGRQAFFRDPNGVMIELTWLKAGKR